MFKKLSILCLCFALFSCGGGSGSSSSDSDTTPDDPNASVLGQRLTLSYKFTIQFSDEQGIQNPFEFPKTYATPVYVSTDGIVTLRARDFPKMVLRICPQGSPRNDCDVYVETDDQDIGSGVDLVLDLCGINNSHSQCGLNDGSRFTGTLSDDGSFNIRSIAVRVRLFNLNDGPNGTTASSAATGIIADLPRIVTTIQTDPSVRFGGITGVGEKIEDTLVTLVAGGVIPAKMPELGGASYVVTLDGSFSQAPLDFLE